ncbi:putative DNA-binding domain-containing protein [Altererythrobacter sp.]|uniref:HvfC/BufC family peptide modification chaperone n=1 Tax=Altererythrobacter sp. TaxID=1872480 RepID=UPI003D00F220
MRLAETQSAFMAQVLDEDVPAPDSWSARQAAGMAVYRNNYRSALVDALRSTYERTARWAGEEAFRRAAAHHLISNPPGGWTIDEAGAGFDATCEALFAHDPEVAELAWLEWNMLQVFTAENRVPLDGAGFAENTSGFGEEDWAELRLAFMPGATARVVNHDLRTIWNATRENDFERPVHALDAPAGALVWREGERPTFLMVAAEEAQAFRAMQEGASYGEVCGALASAQITEDSGQQAAMRAGAMLGRWLNEGMIASLAA